MQTIVQQGCLILVVIAIALALPWIIRHARGAEKRVATLREREESFRLLFSHNPAPMWVYDAATLRFLEVNDAAVAHYGYTREQFLAMAIGDIRPPAEQERLLDDVMMHRPTLQKSGEWRHFLHDGRIISVEITSHTLDFAGRPAVFVMAQDITERRQAEEALRHQALHDALTKLPNRILLFDRLQQTVLAAQRGAEPLALLLLDLDRFKEINDTLGHHHGDILLQQVADRLSGVVRAMDTVARLGGDEFAVLLPGSDGAGAVRVAQMLLDALDDPFVVEGQVLDVGASIGIALAPDHSADGQTLLRQADVSMYVAKRSRSGYAIYTAAQDQNSPARLALMNALRHAIENEQLLLYYQPKMNLASGVVDCAEALVRWRHPEHGLIPPDHFIPVAEHTGLIKSLTVCVLDAALRQCRDWRDRGLDLAVSVNLSMWNLHDPDLPTTIAALLDHHDVSPHKLRVEVTESTIMADEFRTVDVLQRLHRLGVRIAVDDFGTGYSSLAYLKRLPLDELKIDKSFVLHMSEDDADATIVSSTIGLGHSLGLRVVAEGVEDRATLQLLMGLGCDSAQGYYLSRPVPAVDLEQWYRDRNTRGAQSA